MIGTAIRGFAGRTAAAGRGALRPIALCLAVALGLAPIVWATVLSVDLFRGPVTSPRPNDYESALNSVLELQSLAISEAERGEPAFFVAHIGCAAPPVWQDERVFDNFKRMVKLGVEVKLRAGLHGSGGEDHVAAWPKKFGEMLTKSGLDAIKYVGLPKEMMNHSIAAGSARRARAYITFHQEDNRYPTQYFEVRSTPLSLRWKEYLLEVFRKGEKAPTSAQ